MSDARFDDALIAQARAGELRSSGKAQVDAKLLLSALEREVALGAQVKSLEAKCAAFLTLAKHASRIDKPCNELEDKCDKCAILTAVLRKIADMGQMGDPWVEIASEALSNLVPNR